MTIFRELFRRSRGHIILSVAASLLNAAGTMILLAWITRIIDSGSRLDATDWWYCVGLLAAILISGVVSQITMTRIGGVIVYDMQILMAKRLLNTPLERLERIGRPRVYATWTNDIHAVSNAFISYHRLIFNGAMITGGIVYLAYLSQLYLLAILGFLLLGVSVCQWFVRRMNFYMRALRDDQDCLYKNVDAIVNGVKELQLNKRRRKRFLDLSLTSSAKKLRDNHERAFYFWTISNEWGNLIIFLMIGLILYLATSGISGNREILIGYAIIIVFLRGHVSALLSTFPDVSAGNAALRKISMLELAPVEQKQSEDSEIPPLMSTWNTLEIEHVHYEYSNGTDYSFTLGPVSFQIRQGEIMFLVGGNGSGKSTLAKILCGLYVPQNGTQSLGNKKITTQNREWYRNHFCAVFPDFYLFNEVLDNIGKPGDDGTALRYLRRLRLDTKVQTRNSRLTNTDLSQGQRKRLALLAAYMEDRPIYLFDEWAADQDPSFKEVFYRELLVDLKARGKTVIVITHDDRYFDVADRVLKLDEGQLCAVHERKAPADIIISEAI